MARKKEEIEDAIIIHEEDVVSGSPMELGCLMDIILDYYEHTGEASLEQGDEWKKDTEYMPKGIELPADLDKEIKKAFISQIKKFQ